MINDQRKKDGGPDRNAQLDCTLRYFLNFLENVTSFDKIRKVLVDKINELYGVMLQLYDDTIITYSKSTRRPLVSGSSRHASMSSSSG